MKHTRVRKKIQGTADRPRLTVFRSLKYIYAQVIDDKTGNTLVSASSLINTSAKSKDSVLAAKEVGQTLGSLAKAKSINKVVFDRGGYIYHGRIKALAEGAREAGLEF
jgi:large subunit ribosomal protein L18